MTNAYPVFGVLKDPCIKNYAISVVGSVFICTLIYLPVGAFAYLKNGSAVSFFPP